MSRFDQSFRTIRLKHGLRWQDKYPKLQDMPSGKTALIIGLLGLLLIALIVAVQWHNEATEARISASQRTTELADCMAGTLRMVAEDSKSAVVCRKAEVFNI